jgi:hypothetical protein
MSTRGRGLARVSKHKYHRRMAMETNQDQRFSVMVTTGELCGYLQTVNAPEPVAIAAMQQLVRDGLAAVIVPMQHREGAVRIAESTR